MHKLKMRLEGREGELIREVEVEAAFLPRVGDTINAYDHFDDVEAELAEIGWFFIVYEIN